ncbi:hypothetical protein FFWV33_05195 [Flavobacterium faecale]|uniref:Uncharacterized protein n=1 Tax=Flavobacterium faecale TaxID=1355330 RepID=A0A2S1LB60_9FLAO|nr:hypothetical protein FFWV33_05195 [Flavobacterium faecale]
MLIMKKAALYFSLLMSIYFILTLLNVILKPIHKFSQYSGEFRLGLFLSVFAFGYLCHLITQPIKH